MRQAMIKESQIRAQIYKLNKTCGYSDEQIDKREIGVYVLDYAYGGYNLERICNDRGAVRTISLDGYGTKRELYNFLRNYSPIVDTTNEIDIYKY